MPRQSPQDRPVVAVGTLNLSDRARELVNDVLDRNRLSYGPMTKSFEEQFARIHDCRFAAMMNSGTSALHVALGVLKELHGWAEDDEVIVPAVTFVATANVVLHNRMKPVLVDIDPVYYELDPDLIESAVTSKTRAIIPVHAFGQPCDMDPILEIARRHDLKVIEDSCECMFAKYRGRSVGSLGDIGCFSTYVAHLLTTGVGGLAATNVPEYAVKIRSLMNHGRDSIYLSIDDDDGKSDEELRMIVERRFSFVNIGHSFRATEMEAALGLAQLETYEQMIATRRGNAGRLIQDLAEFEQYLQLPKTRPECDHSFMMFPIVLRDRPKSEFVNFLEQNGVETRDMLPLVNQPVYARLLGTRPGQFPVADWVNASGFYIGCHQDLKSADLDHISHLFQVFWRKFQPRRATQSTLVLLTLNSENVLGQVFEDLALEYFDHLIAVDAGSKDTTMRLLEERGIRTIRSGSPYGALLEDAGPDIGDHLVLFPVDGRSDPGDIVRLLLALERGADMVVASRFTQGGARHDQGRRFRYRSTGNRVFTLMANLLFFGNTTDTLTRFFGVTRSFLECLAPTASGIAASYQVSIGAIQTDGKLQEIPTVERVPMGGAGRWQATLSALPLLWVLAREWLKRRREP